MEKKIIGVDCDEVLCTLLPDFIPYMNERLGMSIQYEDIKEYNLSEYFHLNNPKNYDVFLEYTKERPKHVPLIEGAREALLKLSEKYRLVIITGRPEEIWKEATEAWMNNYLSGVPIEKLIFANDRYIGTDADKNKPIKSIICEEENISIFIDDREKYVMECIDSCEQCIVFGEYPWTQHCIEDERVVYLKDWNDVLSILL